MTTRGARKIIPSSKLTADNAGDLELPSHRKAVASASAALTPSAPSPNPSSASLPLPLPQADADNSSPVPIGAPRARPLAKRPSQVMSTSLLTCVLTLTPPQADVDNGSPVAVDVRQARPLAKRSSQAMSSMESIIDISPPTSDDARDLVPQAKKAKTSMASDQQEDLTVLPPAAEIIEIDDVEDPREEVFNKKEATADVKHFFSPAPRLPGQVKKRMQCNVCK